MFFSVNEAYNHFIRGDSMGLYDASTGNHVKSKAGIARVLRRTKQKIVDREGPGKWYRPWSVVPSLRNFSQSLADGEFGVGVEVEYGFSTRGNASHIVSTIRNWKHIAVDREGGIHGVEATFPPVKYHKMNSKSQVYRYIKLLAANASRLYNHEEYSMVGTHVNVSTNRSPDRSRIISLYNALRSAEFTSEDRLKYYGRYRPYNWSMPTNGYHVEYKMFNSTKEWKKVRRYVDIAVELHRLLMSDAELTPGSVRAALEAGYNKHKV